MPTDGDSLEHIGRLLECSSIERVWELHAARMRDFGFDRLIYGANRFRAQGEFGDISDWLILTNHDKEYIDLFFGRALYFHAPMAVWAARNTGVCSWQWAFDRRDRGECSEQELRLLALNERMGVVAGYSISFAHPSRRNKAGIGLCARRGLSQADVEEIWAEHGAEIAVLNEVMNLKISTLPFARNTKPLTARQREVLQWVADGKTVQDVATIMGLTQATVEKHLRLARENLDAETTAQAILKASLQNQFFVFEGLQGDPKQARAQLMAANLPKI